MSSPARDDDSTESPVLLLDELLRAAGVADQLADRTLRTKFFGTSAAREAAASWDHVEASIQALERDLAKVAASIEATSASPALSAIHRAAKKTLSELGDELETKEREKSEIARDFADVWKTWKRQYEREALQKLRDEQKARRAAAKGSDRRSNKTRPPCDSDDPASDAAEEFERAPGGKPNAKSWPGRPLDPPCARCARRETDCHAHENGLKGRRVSCFECNASHVACSLSKKVADRQPASPGSESDEKEQKRRGRSGGGRRVFGPRSVQEAATRNAASADAEAIASNRTAMEILDATLELVPEEHQVEFILRIYKTLPKLGVGSAGQKRKRAAADSSG